MSYITWQPAISLLSELWAVKLKPSIMSHKTTISACEKRWRLQPAPSLLSEMWVVTLALSPYLHTVWLRGGRWMASFGSGL